MRASAPEARSAPARARHRSVPAPRAGSERTGAHRTTTPRRATPAPARARRRGARRSGPLAGAARRWLPLGVVVAVAAVAAGVYVVDQVSFPEIDEPSLLAVVPPAPDLPAVVVAPAGGEATATPEPTTEAPVVEAEPEETEEPAPSRAPSRRAGAAPGGLPWHSGVVVGTPDEVAGWEDYRGRQVDVVHGFAARGAWDDITSAGWIMGYYSDFPGIVVISQPFWPEDSGGSLDACAGGAYDDQWAEYGRTLADHPGMDVYTRLAWEFNGTWFEWSATDAEAWKSCFRSVVDAVRSTAPDARFEWNINAHGSQSCDGDAWNCWPGDEYVDVVGIDPYDHYPSSATAAEFDEQCNDRHGLCYVIDFAREHGKEVGVTEWGVINSGIGDNPLYIEKMYETFEAGSDVMAYETYFNSADHNTTLDGGENPESSAAYRELFGG